MSSLPSPSTVDPNVLYMTAREDVTISIDMTALLIDDDPPTLPQAVLVPQDSRLPVTLLDTPIVDDTAVKQRLRGLSQGTQYKLYISILSSGQRREVVLTVNVARD